MALNWAMNRILIWGLLSFWAIMAQAQAYFPPSLPNITTDTPGGMVNSTCFLGIFRTFQPSPKPPVNVALDENGEMLFYFVRGGYTYDFKLLPDGRMSFYSGSQYLIIDSTLQKVDSVRSIGYTPDVHELTLMPNGHFLLFGNEYRDSMDLSPYQTIHGQPGSATARVQGTVIQELDAAGNLVKEWSALDHFSLADADFANFDDPSFIDFTHGNSLEWDPSGKLMVSWRNLSEVTLLDWNSGNIIWRLGGTGNQFTFLNDTLQFSAQHDARFVGPNRISLFDNGTYRQPRQAQAMIYELDTVNFTATLVNAIRRPYESYGMGSYRYLSDGTHLINWGARSDNNLGVVSWVDAAGNSIREMEFTPVYVTYRAQEGIIPWQIPHPRLSCSDSLGYTVLKVGPGHTKFEWNTGEQTSSIAVSDTGTYFAYVDMGIGMIRTEKFQLFDSAEPCNGVSIEDPIATPRILLETWDLWGRKVENRQKAQVYIEWYSDGSYRKVIEW